MIDLLRSLTWGESKEEKDALGNLTKIQPERLLSMKAAESILLMASLDFHMKYAKAPSVRTLRDFADDLKNPDVTKVLDDVELATFYQGVDFEELFEREVKNQGIIEMTTVCKEAIGLVTSGKKTLEEGISHLYTALRVPSSKTGDKLPASLKKAAPMLEKIYHTRKSKPTSSYGIFTGYGVVDQSTAGIKKKQLYLHAAFPGHLKSTMIQNMMINAAVDYGWNPILFTAEMPADDVMLNFVAIHSANRKFSSVGKPLSSFKLKMGTLNSTEEAFYKDVQDDLVNNPDHGTIRIVDSAEFTTLGSIIQRTIKEHAITEVDQVWIDYLTRLPVDQKYSKMSLTEGRNESITDAKRFAMSFDGGRGLAVCSAFQTNRESYKRVKERMMEVADPNPAKTVKAAGYDMTCLGQYNNAEKEADVITYTWYDEEERKNQEPKLGILKSRWGDTPAEMSSLFIERDSRRVFDMTQGMRVSSTPTMAAGGSEDVTL